MFPLGFDYLMEWLAVLLWSVIWLSGYWTMSAMMSNDRIVVVMLQNFLLLQVVFYLQMKSKLNGHQAILITVKTMKHVLIAVQFRMKILLFFGNYFFELTNLTVYVSLWVYGRVRTRLQIDFVRCWSLVCYLPHLISQRMQRSQRIAVECSVCNRIFSLLDSCRIFFQFTHSRFFFSCDLCSAV